MARYDITGHWRDLTVYGPRGTIYRGNVLDILKILPFGIDTATYNKLTGAVEAINRRGEVVLHGRPEQVIQNLAMQGLVRRKPHRRTLRQATLDFLFF